MLISLDNHKDHKETLSLAGKDVNDASLRMPLTSKGFSDAFEDSLSNGFEWLLPNGFLLEWALFERVRALGASEN